MAALHWLKWLVVSLNSSISRSRLSFGLCIESEPFLYVYIQNKRTAILVPRRRFKLVRPMFSETKT